MNTNKKIWCKKILEERVGSKLNDQKYIFSLYKESCTAMTNLRVLLLLISEIYLKGKYMPNTALKK